MAVTPPSRTFVDATPCKSRLQFAETPPGEQACRFRPLHVVLVDEPTAYRRSSVVLDVGQSPHLGTLGQHQNLPTVSSYIAAFEVIGGACRVEGHA